MTAFCAGDIKSDYANFVIFHERRHVPRTTNPTTRERILRSAKAMFLERGYERSNLREICADAGVTTGAFYRHFSDKEELFAELVEPAAKELKDLLSGAEGECIPSFGALDLERIFAVDAEATRSIMKVVYRWLDEFALILGRSDGTPYADFVEELVEMEAAGTARLYDRLEATGARFERLGPEQVRSIAKGYYASVFDSVVAHLSEDEALACADAIAEFYTAGWKATLLG